MYVHKTETNRVLIMSVQFCGTSPRIIFLSQFFNIFHHVPSKNFISFIRVTDDDLYIYFI